MATLLNVFYVATTSNRLDQAQVDQALQISVGGVVNHAETGAAPTIGDGTFSKNVIQNLSLALVQLRFYCRGDQEPLLGHPQALDVIARTGECNLEVTHIGAKERRIEPVVEHLVVHPAEAAATFLYSMEI
jgi:hypothetical protein